MTDALISKWEFDNWYVFEGQEKSSGEKQAGHHINRNMKAFFSLWQSTPVLSDSDPSWRCLGQMSRTQHGADLNLSRWLSSNMV